MATEQQLMKALRAADAANDTRAAKLFRSKIMELRAGQQPAVTPQPDITAQPEIVAEPQVEAEPTFNPLEQMVGGQENMLSMATGGAASIAGGLAGLVGSVLPGPEGQGADVAKRVQEAGTYQPRTDAGKAMQQGAGEVIEPLIGMATQVPGDFVYDLATNPQIRAAAEMFPQLKLMTENPEMAGTVGQLIVPALLERFGVKTNKAIKTSKDAKEVLVNEIKAGNRNIDNITQVLDANDNLIKNPMVKQASEILGDKLKGKQHAIELELMSKADRGQLNKMLDIVEKQRRLGTRYAMENRPSNVVGESIAGRIKAAIKLKNKSNKELSQVVDGDVGRELVNTSGPSRKFFDALESEGVAIGRNEGGKLTVNLDNSTARLGDVLPKAELERVLNMLDVDEMTIAKAHKMKRFVREYVSYDDGIQVGAKTSKPIENAIKGLSTEINDVIAQKSPAYAKANAKFSSVIDSISSAQKQLKGMDIDSDLANSKLGNLSKKLGTNYGSKEKIFELIDTLDESLGKNKIKFNDDIRSQVSSLALLDDVFRMQETEAPFGFVSGISKGARDTASGQSASMQALDAAIGKLKSMRDPDFNKKMAVLRRFAEKK
jgi:hypothetical protein